MSARLILVSGLSGSGKTTLIRGALQQIPELIYLKTYTTRPMRPGEQLSHEYNFVSQEDYETARRAASEWDHTEYAGYYYGADAGSIKNLLNDGKNVICSVAPDMDIIADMAELYGAEPVTIWIKTPKDIARQRIYKDDIRDARNEDFAISTNFDYIFEPQGSIEPDTKAFVVLLRQKIGI